ncbi:DUF5958 family protein [Streptomyces microflavus]|uniref:DUF5958 family protein n=1 Tax=Streptomyces microflavus TaxID=1919 RepID=UPI003646217F
MLNELLQGQRPIGQGVDWFEALTAEGQFRDPPDLADTASKRARRGGPESVRLAGIRPTHTPAVLITRGQLAGQLKENSPPPTGRACEGVSAVGRAAWGG